MDLVFEDDDEMTPEQEALVDLREYGGECVISAAEGDQRTIQRKKLTSLTILSAACRWHLKTQ